MSSHHVQSYYMDVYDFHRKFELPRPEGFRPLSYELFKFRQRFLQEELDEFIEAYNRQEHEKVLDALVDLVYVAIGTAVMMGADFNAAWRLVHEANMLKVRAVRAEDSKRMTTYDVVKPHGWKAPDLSHLVRG
jgi:predicted HAD superfamily Cof-like phosphohydrolase